VSIAIAGTHTNIGKTFLSACMIAKYGKFKNLFYWKPIQTGSSTDTDSDTHWILKYSGADPEFVFPPAYTLSFPSSPDYAAWLEGREISLDRVVEEFKFRHSYANRNGGILLIELAGGVYVPWNDKKTTLDFLKEVQIPVLLAVSMELGTINHSLLTIEACKVREIPVLGFIGFSFHNSISLVWESSAKSIERFSMVPCLGSYSIGREFSIEDFRTWAERNFDPENQIGSLLNS